RGTEMIGSAAVRFRCWRRAAASDTRAACAPRRLKSATRILAERDGPQPALLVPRHTKQIEDAVPKTVPDTVFRDSGGPRSVIDRHLFCGDSASLDQNREEAMPTIEREHAGQR